MSATFQMIVQVFIACEIVFFNIFGLFGNINFIVLTVKKSQLQSKSSYLQCALSVSHSLCLLFELPNAVFLFTGSSMRRTVCFQLLSPYIFFICAQAMIMLMLVIDIYVIVYFPTLYRTMSNVRYTLMFLSIPSIYGLFTLVFGIIELNDEMLQFCNPPVGLPPIVSRFWSLSNVVFNSITLSLFIILMIIFHFKGKRQKKDTKKLMNRLKVSVVVFSLSWYMCTLGVDIISAIGLTGELFGFLQANMVFFALLCYTQPFYVIIWRSSEYYDAFLEMWSFLPYVKRLINENKKSSTFVVGVTSTAFTR